MDHVSVFSCEVGFIHRRHARRMHERTQAPTHIYIFAKTNAVVHTYAHTHTYVYGR